jgi:hypothetical protein
MKISKWTKMLLSAGLVSIPALALAEDAPVPSTVLTALSSTTLSGYVDTTAVWKFGTGDANMPGRTYDGADVQDGFNLNVVSLTLDKPLDTNDWSAGYHVQMLMGPGATKRGTGIATAGSGGPIGTDFSFNEAYINLSIPIGNGLQLHIGQFGTYNGYEAYDTYKDPNWSRSYGFFIESSAHTGISANYTINDMFSMQAGVGNAAGFNNEVNGRQSIESKKAYLVMGTFTAPASFGFAKGATLSAGYTVGDHQLDASTIASTGVPAGGTRFNQGNLYVGGTLPLPVTGLALGAAYDYTYGQTMKSDYANATALYLTYNMDKWTFANRVDYASGSAGVFDGLASNGHADQLISETFTAGYSLWKNVITRGEFRWDHSLSADRPFGGTVAGSPSNKNAVSVALNIIYQF